MHGQWCGQRHLDRPDIIKLEAVNKLKLPGFMCLHRGAGFCCCVSEAFRLIVSDSKVKAILVNIFGGIVRCDMIARAIIHALNEARITLPVVVRLSGNNAAEAVAQTTALGLGLTCGSRQFSG